jgi:hypothetical protein
LCDFSLAIPVLKLILAEACRGSIFCLTKSTYITLAPIVSQ